MIESSDFTGNGDYDYGPHGYIYVEYSTNLIEIPVTQSELGDIAYYDSMAAAVAAEEARAEVSRYAST